MRKVAFILISISLVLNVKINAQKIAAFDIRIEGGYTGTDISNEKDKANRLLSSRAADFIRNDYSIGYIDNSFTNFSVEAVHGVKSIEIGKKAFSREFRTGFLYSNTKDDGVYLKTTYGQSMDSVNDVSFRYNVNRYQLSGTYLLNTKSIGKNWKFYGGLSLGVSLNSYGGNGFQNLTRISCNQFRQSNDTQYFISQNIFRQSSELKIINYSVVTNLILGVKYNVNCDMNLFLEYRFNSQVQTLWNKFFLMGQGISFGFRVKLRNEQELKDVEPNALW